MTGVSLGLCCLPLALSPAALLSELACLAPTMLWPPCLGPVPQQQVGPSARSCRECHGSRDPARREESAGKQQQRQGFGLAQKRKMQSRKRSGGNGTLLQEAWQRAVCSGFREKDEGERAQEAAEPACVKREGDGCFTSSSSALYLLSSPGFSSVTYSYASAHKPQDLSVPSSLGRITGL